MYLVSFCVVGHYLKFFLELCGAGRQPTSKDSDQLCGKVWGGNLNSGSYPIHILSSHVHSLSMFVDMRVNILWGKFVKMTSINENLIMHWSLIFDFILLINFEL